MPHCPALHLAQIIQAEGKLLSITIPIHPATNMTSHARLGLKILLWTYPLALGGNGNSIATVISSTVFQQLEIFPYLISAKVMTHVMSVSPENMTWLL